MPSIPRDGPFDRSLAFMAEGYDYIGNRCRRFGSDIFETVTSTCTARIRRISFWEATNRRSSTGSMKRSTC